MLDDNRLSDALRSFGTILCSQYEFQPPESLVRFPYHHERGQLSHLVLYVFEAEGGFPKFHGKLTKRYLCFLSLMQVFVPYRTIAIFADFLPQFVKVPAEFFLFANTSCSTAFYQ